MKYWCPDCMGERLIMEVTITVVYNKGALAIDDNIVLEVLDHLGTGEGFAFCDNEDCSEYEQVKGMAYYERTTQ